MTKKAWPAAIVVAIGVALAAAPALAQKEKDYAKGELLVKFRTGHDGKAAEAIEKIGARVLEKLSRLDVSRIDLPKGLDVDKAIARFKALPFVEFAEPNYIFKPTWSTSDPRWDDQWGLRKISTPAGWGIETGRSEVIIAIVDTGVELDHPDLVAKLVPGYDFVDDDDRPDDVGGHGTHCAGIAAASTNNGKGVAGVCANCSVMPLRVLGPDGGLASDVAKGIIWAADHGAQVISMSLGGFFPSSTQEDAIEYAWSKGAILVAASGNSGVEDPHYPAYHSTCVAVGSTEEDDSRSYFSNYGDWVDVAAPGSYIMSTVPGGGYEMKSGTSMATPFVAGLAGLLWSELGGAATNAKVRAAIESTADPVGGWVARGRINVGKALGSVKGSAPPAKEPTKEPAKEPAKEPDKGGAAKNADGGFAPRAYGVDKGSTLKSPQDSLTLSDDSLLILRSTQSGKRRYLDFHVTSRAEAGGAVESLTVIFEGRSYIDPVTLTADLWNWRTGQWVGVGKAALGTADTRVELARNGASDFVSGTGEMKARFRAESDWFSTFDVGADQVEFVPKKKKVAEGGKEPVGGEKAEGGGDGSLGEKAADAWKKLIGG